MLGITVLPWIQSSSFLFPTFLRIEFVVTVTGERAMSGILLYLQLMPFLSVLEFYLPHVSSTHQKTAQNLWMLLVYPCCGLPGGSAAKVPVYPDHVRQCPTENKDSAGIPVDPQFPDIIIRPDAPCDSFPMRCWIQYISLRWRLGKFTGWITSCRTMDKFFMPVQYEGIGRILTSHQRWFSFPLTAV